MIFPVKKTFISLLILLFTIPIISLARNEDNTLGILKVPNEGCPVITAPGQTFKVISEEKGTLYLIDSKNNIQPLNADWKEIGTNKWEALATVAEKGIKKGAFALQIITDTQRKDINPRCIWVQKAFKDYYIFAHISDIHIRSDDPNDEHALLFQKVIEKLNKSDAHFVLLTGDLTHDGTLEQFNIFLNIMNQCQKPTFVCAGNHDRTEDNYEKIFSTSTYAFRYGKDGFIIFDTREYRTADSWGEQDTFLYRYRRELKSCRWTFGITHRYEPTMGMRAQTILFIDDPIDFILYGHIHRENTKEESILPWGKTRVFVVPAEKDGYYRIFDVGEGGLFPRPIQNIKN